MVTENMESGKHFAIDTGQFERIECRLVLKSIGYKSVPINDLPFDYYEGQMQFEKGSYVCGWLNRSLTGLLLPTSTVLNKWYMNASFYEQNCVIRALFSAELLGSVSRFLIA